MDDIADRGDLRLRRGGEEPRTVTRVHTVDRHGVSAADVHQLLAYSSGYAPADAPMAVIVHPQPGSHTQQTLQVQGLKGLLGTIHVLGVATRTTPERATAWMASALR